MRSIKEIFVVGHGPSSSHTMGPANAVNYIINKYGDSIDFVKVILYGSLALTGKGHLTDKAIEGEFEGYNSTIEFDYTTKTDHPNTMAFEIQLKNGKIVREEVVSIGGGTIITADSKNSSAKDTYPHNSMKEILEYCDENNLSLSDYVLKFENSDIIDYIKSVLNAMMSAVKRGVSTRGELPGRLHIQRKAPEMYERLLKEVSSPNNKEEKAYELMMATTSIAASEENASGGIVCTGPTCGSSGVIPGVLAYIHARGIDIETIYKGMLVAGLIGIICKTNGSVSGAEAGCQAEIGVACSMGAGLIAYCDGLENHKIAQSAEIALEHSLGLTCDPIGGYVIIPCIERCAMYALKARDAVNLAKLVPSEYGVISLDDAIKTMLETGKDIKQEYKETSINGLSKLYESIEHRDLDNNKEK